MLQSIIEQDNAPEQISQEQADQECELEALSLCHATFNLGLVQCKLISLHILGSVTPIVIILMIKEGLFLCSLLHTTTSPHMPNLPSNVNSHEG